MLTRVIQQRSAVALAAAAIVGASALALLPHEPAQAQPAAVARGLPDFTDLVEQVGPAVVNIRTLERVSSGGRRSRALPQIDEETEDMLRRFGIPLPNMPRGQGRGQGFEREVPRGMGSGFILTPDGYVMTNHHVVDEADEIIVTLSDKREFKARLIGADERTDVAVLKIDASGLPAVKIGDASRVRVGEWVMAIGSPFGLESTVTAGIVSAKQRDTGSYLPFIQTDVAVNPGNSGGPLINLRGEVVGINSQIYSRSGGFMGISFAIPIDEAMKVSEQLRATGHVTRGRIGVQIGEVSREVAESIGLGKAQGALVSHVQSGSPAEKAGVRAGDIITRFDGQPIEKVSDLPRMVGNAKPGTRGTVTVFRQGKSLDLNLTVAAMEPEKGGSRTASAAGEPKTAASQSLGLAVADLSAEQKTKLKTQRGVRITDVDGPAASVGLRPGDIILAVANTDVSSAAEFEAAASKAMKGEKAGKPVNLLVQRGDMVQYVLLHPAAQ